MPNTSCAENRFLQEVFALRLMCRYCFENSNNPFLFEKETVLLIMTLDVVNEPVIQEITCFQA